MIDNIIGKHRMRAAVGAFAAAACCAAALITPQTARAADAITVGQDGTVPSASVPTDGTPAITKVRVLNEGNFLEVYWNEYVDENAAIDPANFVLKNGANTIPLEAKAADYNGSNTIYFDKDNKEIAATSWRTMDELDPDIHLSSICYDGTIDPSQPITLEVKGSAIKDAAGNAAADATYAGVPKTNYYTKFLTSKTGILIKGDSKVSDKAMSAAAAQVDIELGKTENGIGARMAKAGASLAIFPPEENVYFLPEHRYYFNKNMYAVEGYGGTAYTPVSSIAERNVLRIRNAADGRNTMYTNENILIHEFGHAVKLVGMEQLADQSLSREFQRLYRSRKALGMWPNTYAISNSDEFFATMAAIWFSVMAESPDFSNGINGPVNTRADLKRYDPKTYAFFSKIFPDDTLASPWDPADTPDHYHLDAPAVPSGDMNVAPFAEATASHSNDTYGAGADNAADMSTGSYWNNWSDPFGNYGDATGPWLQLKWDGQARLTSVNLKLWSDGGGVPQISGDGQWKLQYDASADGSGSGGWQDVPLADGATYGSSYGSDGNEIKFASPITASRLRVVFAAGTVAGVSEFEAYGQEVEPEATKVTGVKVSGDGSLTVGDSTDLDAEVTPANADNATLDWSSSAASVATVSADGRVTALKAGTATITAAATDGSGAKGTLDVTVSADPENVAPSAAVSASYTNTTLPAGANKGEKINDNAVMFANTPAQTWNNWGDPGTGYGDATGPWVRLDWTKRMSLTGARLFLWSDNGGVPQLGGAGQWKLQALDASGAGSASASGSDDAASGEAASGEAAWKDVALASGSSYAASYADGNAVEFAAPVTATALRVVFAKGAIVGVSELQAFGKEAPAEPEPEPSRDTVAPVFAGVVDASVEFGASFDPLAGVTASDDMDGDVTASIKVSGTVDTKKAGAYTLTYTAADKAGNEASAKRTVTVKAQPVQPDTVKPVIKGADDVTVEYGSDFDPKAGVTATDDRDGDLTGSIKVSGTVDTSKAGAYTLTYTVADKAGNTAETKRTVTVKAKPAEPEPEPSKTLRFTDVTAVTPHHDDIQWLGASGISTGWKTGETGTEITAEFRPMNEVIRQDMAAFLYRLAGEPAFDETKAANPFADVTKDTPHYKEILWLYAQGISQGYTDKETGTRTFGGDRMVVRQDMAAFLHKLAVRQDASPSLGQGVTFTDLAGASHVEDIQWLARAGVTTGWKNPDGKTAEFRGMNVVVRQDMAAFLHRMSSNVLK